MYVSVFVELVFVGFFSEIFTHWVFSSVFFLVGIGQHLLIVCAPSCVLCVSCFVSAVIMMFSSGVHRVPYIFLLAVIMTFSSGMHRAPYIILA